VDRGIRMDGNNTSITRDIWSNSVGLTDSNDFGKTKTTLNAAATMLNVVVAMLTVVAMHWKDLIGEKAVNI